MHDFNCFDPDEMQNPMLREKSKYYKESEEGIAEMCKMMEEMRNEAALQATMQREQEMARTLFEKKMTVEFIADCVKRPIDVVCAWLGITPAQA